MMKILSFTYCQITGVWLPDGGVLESGLEVIKLFFKLSSAEHEISTAHKC